MLDLLSRGSVINPYCSSICCLLYSCHSPTVVKDEQDFKGPLVPAVLFWTCISVTVHLWTDKQSAKCINDASETFHWWLELLFQCEHKHSSRWRWICLVLWRPRGSSGVILRCVSSLTSSDDSNRNSTHCTCLSEIHLPWYSNVDLWESQSINSFQEIYIAEAGSFSTRHNASHPKQKNFLFLMAPTSCWAAHQSICG